MSKFDEQDILTWHNENWGAKTNIRLAAKMGEEMGEVLGACIKIPEGRLTVQDLKDELGDLLITASVLAGKYGWTLDQLRDARFESVGQRTGSLTWRHDG